MLPRAHVTSGNSRRRSFPESSSRWKFRVDPRRQSERCADVDVIDAVQNCRHNFDRGDHRGMRRRPTVVTEHTLLCDDAGRRDSVVAAHWRPRGEWAWLAAAACAAIGVHSGLPDPDLHLSVSIRASAFMG